METEQRIASAKDVLHHLLGRYGKPGHRIHKTAAQDNVNRLNALEGLCGHCTNLQIDFRHKDGKDRVILDCRKGHIPSALYENALIGTEVTCPDFDEKI